MLPGMAVSGAFLELSGACNARDLGGLAVAGGGTTASGRILRSDLLVALSDADSRALLADGVGLRSVVDLRTPAETEAFPGPWQEAGVEVLLAPLPVDPAFEQDRTSELLDIYLSFLEPPATAITAALEALLDTGRHPVLIHCAAGKDRTGVLVALALELLGVERSEIVADYALTHERMPLVVERLEREAGHDRRRYRESLQRADAETMASFLAGLDQRHGGATAWARQRAIDPTAIDHFRTAMVLR